MLCGLPLFQVVLYLHICITQRGTVTELHHSEGLFPNICIGFLIKEGNNTEIILTTYVITPTVIHLPIQLNSTFALVCMCYLYISQQSFFFNMVSVKKLNVFFSVNQRFLWLFTEENLTLNLLHMDKEK